jgi:hypothetical protein
MGAREEGGLGRHAGWGPPPEVQQRCHWRGRREEREGHLQAHSGLLVVAHCPRQPSHRLFAQSQHEREQRGSRMCTRPAHAHTCVAASGAHSLARLPRAEYVLGAGGHGTQTRGGSIAREGVDSFSRGGSHTVPLSRVMPSLCLCSCVPCWLASFVAFPLVWFAINPRCDAAHMPSCMALTLCSACPALPVVILLLYSLPSAGLSPPHELY